MNVMANEAARASQFDEMFKSFPQPPTIVGRGTPKGSQRHVSFAPGVVMTSGPMVCHSLFHFYVRG